MKRDLLTTSVAALVALTTLAACSSSGGGSNAIASLGELPTVAPPTSAPPATTTGPSSERKNACKANHLATASYRARLSDDGFIATLRSLGRIRVGLDENTQGLSARDPLSGDLEGFEVDLAHEIAKRLFGDAYTYDSVVPIPLLTSEKTDAVKDQSVDITISAVSMSCDRWEDVDFSAEYYTAHQTFLVRIDSDMHDQADLADHRVCVTTSSSSKRIMEEAVPDANLDVEDARTDCLRALQQAEVDAYFGHDTFQRGMLEQDSTLEPRELLDPTLTVSHYGIAVNRHYPELTRLINFYLEDIVATGKWSELVCKWLTWNCHGEVANITAPVPDYRRES
jgi:polar amino acid transport system substrate-binding protein